MKCCENCMFSKSNGTSNKTLDCKRYPPNSVYTEGYGIRTQPPAMYKTDYCGEFKPKAEGVST